MSVVYAVTAWMSLLRMSITLAGVRVREPLRELTVTPHSLQLAIRCLTHGLIGGELKALSTSLPRPRVDEVLGDLLGRSLVLAITQFLS